MRVHPFPFVYNQLTFSLICLIIGPKEKPIRVPPALYTRILARTMVVSSNYDNSRVSSDNLHLKIAPILNYV